MSDKLSTVDIKHIDLRDERYKISLAKTDTKSLANSIKYTGLINPPILRLIRPKNSSYIIISGFNRIKALQYNNVTKFSALILPRETSELEYYTKAIAAKAFQRPLTHDELIQSIARLVKLCDIQEIAENSSSIFNTKLNLSFIKDLEGIGNLPKPALELIQVGSLSIKSAKRMLNMLPENISLFLDLFSKINASSSKQLEIITNMIETAARGNIPLHELIKEMNIESIVMNEDTPPGVKANQVRSILYEKRFPVLSNTYKKVQKSISELKLGPNIKIIPPANFEGKNYTITFNSKTAAEFEKQFKKLERVLSEDNLKKVFSP